MKCEREPEPYVPSAISSIISLFFADCKGGALGYAFTHCPLVLNARPPVQQLGHWLDPLGS